jgi:hypothetical protein
VVETTMSVDYGSSGWVVLAEQAAPDFFASVGPMRALPERAVAGFTEALIAERLPFLDPDQQASTAQFVVARWRLASQPVQLGTGAVASVLGATAWSLAAMGGSDPDGAWRTLVHGLSGRALPGLSELSLFVVSLATAYAADQWPDAAIGAMTPASR